MTKSRGLRIHNRNIMGMTFGRWEVIGTAPRDNHGFACWFCQCNCGTKKIVNENSLIRGLSTSCGCLTREANSKRGKHHETKTKLYRCWRHMRSRCENPNEIGYKHYGGRGITICERWMKFENFRDDMGDHPGKGYSIDRINNDGNYEPSNCRWATNSQQNSNQRKQTCVTCGMVCKSGAGVALHTRKMHVEAQ